MTDRLPTTEDLDEAHKMALVNSLAHCSLNVSVWDETANKWLPIEVLCKDADALMRIAFSLQASGRHRIIDFVSPQGRLIGTLKNPDATGAAA